MMRFVFLLAIVFTNFCLPAVVLGHGDSGFDAGTQVDATLVVNYRDDSMVSSDGGQLQPWYITGAMLGGEALPYEEGFVVDEASVSIFHMNPSGVYGNLKLMSHSQESAQLEHAYVGLHLTSEAAESPLRMEVGRMAGLFSPENPRHSSDRLMAESPLALDVFLGRQFNDDGVRLLWGNLAPDSGFLLGAETWRGKAFPASAAQGGEAYDIFARYHIRQAAWNFTLGGWAMAAKAEGRTDDRYDSSHNHAVDASEVPAYTFDGDSELAGINLAVHWQANELLTLALLTEWYQLTLNGVLRDETRSAGIESDAEGSWLQLELGYQRHTLGLRYETLVFNNHFTGAGGEPLANDLSLNNQGFEPERNTIGYRYQLRPQIHLRVEWVQDDTQETNSALGDRFILGVVWKQELWSN